MKQKIAIIVSLVLVVGLMWTGSAFAQVDQDGVPVALAATEEPMADPTEEPDGELEESNPFCDGVFEHPVLIRIATQYEEISLEDLQMYFCEYDFGVGEIILMLETIARSEEDITREEILMMRTDDELGWGEIWQSLGLIGRGRKGNDSEDTEETESFARNENRKEFKNENKPDTPPGQDKDKSHPNKPAHPLGKDKSENHPGNGKRP